MNLNEKRFIKIATSTQEFAVQNKTRFVDHNVLVVFGEDNIIPEYTDSVIDNAFVLYSNKEPSSLNRNGIPGAVYVAPTASFASIGLKVWTE